MPTPLPLVKSIESVTQTGAGQGSSYYLYDAQNRLSRQVEGAGSAAEHLIYLEGYEDRVGGYRTRSYVDDYAHVTRYRYGQLELRFVLTDRLGSVVGVVRADRDSGGSVRALEPEVGLAYDVFGAPRHASDWSPLVGTESWPQARNPWDVTPTTRHGFTGHEMLSKQRLIHMRGRLFDPRMGRFTGVDPVIQFPLSTQGLNPYSYLLNNPLAGTDPTGYVADWESVQERMWAMAGGYGANGSSTTAVLNGLRSAAAAVGMSGAAGDAKAGGVATSSAGSGRADNGGNVTQTPQKGATPDQPDGIESAKLLPQIVVVAETRAERLARKAMGRDAWTLFGIQGATVVVGGGVALAPEVAAIYYANGEKIVGAGVLTLEALAGDAVGGASVAVPVAAAGARTLSEVAEYAAPYFSGGAREAARGATPALETTVHGAERIAGAAATRGGVLSVDGVAAVRASGRVLTQADGATVRVLETSAGRFNVVVEGERGIITTFENLKQKSFDRLAKNYGWE